MIIAKDFRDQIDRVVQCREFHPGDPGLRTGMIDTRVEDVIVNFIEVSSDHRDSCLTPVMSDLEWWLGNVVQPDQEIQDDPETKVEDISAYPSHTSKLRTFLWGDPKQSGNCGSIRPSSDVEVVQDKWRDT